MKFLRILNKTFRFPLLSKYIFNKKIIPSRIKNDISMLADITNKFIVPWKKFSYTRCRIELSSPRYGKFAVSGCFLNNPDKMIFGDILRYK
jgi:hypothetical protein